MQKKHLYSHVGKLQSWKWLTFEINLFTTIRPFLIKMVISCELAWFFFIKPFLNIRPHLRKLWIVDLKTHSQWKVKSKFHWLHPCFKALLNVWYITLLLNVQCTSHLTKWLFAGDDHGTQKSSYKRYQNAETSWGTSTGVEPLCQKWVSKKDKEERVSSEL